MTTDDERRILAKWAVGDGGAIISRDIAVLYAEVQRLRSVNVSLVNRCAAAAEVLGRIANRERLTCSRCGAVVDTGAGVTNTA